MRKVTSVAQLWPGETGWYFRGNMFFEVNGTGEGRIPLEPETLLMFSDFRKAAKAGECFLTQRKISDELYEYQATRRSSDWKHGL